MRRLMLITALTAGALAGCADGPDYYYAERVTGRTFAPLNAQVGVYPDDSVLIDPENPFAEVGVGEARWDIQAYGDPVAAFYAWATYLSFIPTGENQFYAALNMSGIFQSGRASEADLPLVQALAIAGFQSVLDNFPDAVTYDSSGTVPFELLTPSYRGIVALGGTPHGWTLVSTADGGEVAVQIVDVPEPEEAE